MTHQTTEPTLGPWYFDGERFRAAGFRNIGPDFGKFTQGMLLGLVRRLRVWKEARAVRPVRSPALVRSYAAAERDPTWQAARITNAAVRWPAHGPVPQSFPLASFAVRII